MWRFALVLVCAIQVCSAQAVPGPQIPQSAPATNQSSPPSTITVPAGTLVELAITQPVLARTAKPGDDIYAVTAFPVAINNRMAIPPGTYVQGQINSLTRPGAFSPHAEFQIHFTKLIFPDGYVVDFRGPQNITAATGSPTAPPADVIPAVAVPYVQVTIANDVLLDNGTQIEMILQLPLELNAISAGMAASQAVPIQFDQFKSATMCRSYPGTPGTAPTVIPGTPGTSGTPPVVIPGAPGQPPTTIPGTPGTPGTPPTVIPGTPGTPGYYCPPPPVVTRPKLQNYKESFAVTAPLQIGGKQLAPGRYEVTWSGPTPTAEVQIARNATTTATLQARIVILDAKASADAIGTRANPDGSLSLDSLRFEGENFALYFD